MANNRNDYKRKQMYKVLTTIVLICSMAMGTQAQDGSVTIIKDSKIDALMEFYAQKHQAKEKAAGFRIQILAGTSRDKAYSTESKFRRDFPQHRTYLAYNSPYFKIRVGDFEDRLVAYRTLQQIKLKYPGSFLVEEKIDLR